VLWSVHVPDEYYYAPVGRNDTFFVSSHLHDTSSLGSATQYLVAVNAHTGKEYWRQKFITSFAFEYLVLDGSTLYCIAPNADFNEVIAFDLNTLKIKWRNVVSILLRRGDAEVCFSNDYVFISEDHFSITAINKVTGVTAWTKVITTEYGNNRAIVYNDILYVKSGDRFLYADHASTGVNLWSYKFSQGFGGYLSMVYAAGNSIVFTGYDDDKQTRILVCLEADTGVERWRTPVNNFTDYPVIAGSKVYVEVNNVGVANANKIAGYRLSDGKYTDSLKLNAVYVGNFFIIGAKGDAYRPN